MKAYVFPGQASQFEGMGKDMYEESALAKELFEKANEILGYTTCCVFTFSNQSKNGRR